MTPATALDNTIDNVVLASRLSENRDKTRYVVCIGNHLEDDDLLAFKSLGAHMGGLWVGPSEVAGAPTMRRTNYFCYRGGITPIETRPVPKKADHKARERQDETFMQGEGVPVGTRAYMSYAADTMGFLMSDSFRPMGIVEVASLQFIPWKEANVVNLQRFFFPDWDLWLKGEKAAPVLLTDWEGLVNDAVTQGAGSPLVNGIGQALLESGRLFRRYASDHIEKNRQRILSQRQIDSGGFYIGWNNRSRTYARQLNTQLENEDNLRPAQGYQIPQAGDPALIATMQAQMKQNQEMMQLLAALAKEKLGDEVLGQYAQEFTAPAAQPQPEVEETHDVSIGTIEDAEDDVLTEPVRTADPERAAQIERQERDNLERAIDRDPSFADAVEADPELRAQINDHPALAGAIDED